MDSHERLKYLREQLNLTTRAFGASINMSGGAITNMEKGQRNITDRTIRDICREYNVNPDWLANGNEPMYEDIVGDLDISDEVKQLSKQYSMLSDKDRELVKNMINSLCEKIAGQPQPNTDTKP
ncbi:MAG: XRE family transcriptional regulator [Clostridia bacterium]|nr:XRE family transcriptional regulator [Clostridia bacterium]